MITMIEADRALVHLPEGALIGRDDVRQRRARQVDERVVRRLPLRLGTFEPLPHHRGQLAHLVRDVKFADPPSDCLGPVGEYNLRLGIMKELQPQLVATFADKAGVGTTVRAAGSAALTAGSALAQGVKQLLPSRRETAITRAVKALMENKGTTPDEESYGYLDPKLPGHDVAATARVRSGFAHAIVFAVGPGNYLEYQALRQSVAPPSGTQAGVPGAARRVSYGCTDVVSATDFLKQLGELAAKGGAA